MKMKTAKSNQNIKHNIIQIFTAENTRHGTEINKKNPFILKHEH